MSNDDASTSSKADVEEPNTDKPTERLLLDDVDTLDALEKAYLAAQQETESKWLNYNEACYIYLYRGGGQPNSRLAAFDLDGTLIKPKSRKKIPQDALDWQPFSVWTKVKLQQVIRENQARFVIFTNQMGVSLRRTTLEVVQERIEAVMRRYDIPCTVFVAIERDGFRKPDTGMFSLFEKSFNDSVPIDLDGSFYCGDAIGYPSFSDADIKLAQAIGLPFLTPEKFLRGVKPKLLPSSEPSKIDSEIN